MSKPDNQTHIRLAIRGSTVDWYRVSDVLDCEPSSHMSPGDTIVDRSGVVHKRTVGLWALDTTDFIGSDNLADHARELLNRIKPASMREFLLDPEVSVQLFLWWVGDELTEGWSLSSDLLKHLCEICDNVNSSFNVVAR